jgi:hypothetical protein
MRKLTATERRRYAIEGAGAMLSVSLLAAGVIVANVVFGLSALISIVAGGSVGGSVAHLVIRRFLPTAPPWSDEERVQLPRVRPSLLFIGIAGILALWLIVRLQLAASVIVMVLAVVGFVSAEWRLRNQAEQRLRAAGRMPTPNEP